MVLRQRSDFNYKTCFQREQSSEILRAASNPPGVQVTPEGVLEKKVKMKMRKIDNICREKLPQINSLQKIETLLSTYIHCCLIGTKEASKQV